MEPLQIVAKLGGAVCLPHGRPALDGMLAYAVAVRDALPPALLASECAHIEIPVAREPGGRFHLASFGEFAIDRAELRHINRKFPTAEAQALAIGSFRRINISAGAQKSYRLPLETFHVVDDAITWWAIGDKAPIEDLLAIVPYVGKKRGVGLGRVRDWSVSVCEPWSDGFPVVRDGQPLRALPAEWPGLVDAPLAYATLTYPRWDHTKEELCAVPA